MAGVGGALSRGGGWDRVVVGKGVWAEAAPRKEPLAAKPRELCGEGRVWFERDVRDGSSIASKAGQLNVALSSSC